jgi:hypothetical protein
MTPADADDEENLMRLITLAAGVAVGYVLGTRAGREKYEQIADNARRLYANPTLEQAQQAVRNVTSPPAAQTRPLAE